ncbi:hypothetical protein CL616_05255 [archaeon]|jgi:hypothetical protein|nr:hypothetical protein [archaeon]|tara:strand:+ start:71 stop:553 length:483 start_codon:yes stop_codon:yes gene_type:complete
MNDNQESNSVSNNKIMEEIKAVRKDIKNSIVPKFVEVSIQTKDLVEHAVEIWRLENRLKIISIDSEENKKLIANSINKLKRYLEKNDIGIIDYTNQKYNDGLNLDVLAIEKKAEITESIIEETKEPTVTHKGKVINKGKVIVLMRDNNSKDITTGVQNEQ